MKPGPHPRSKCPKEIHLRLEAKERDIIDGMGVGRAMNKILHLIHERGERMFPKDKDLLKAKWTESREAVKKMNAMTETMRRMLIEMGCTADELNGYEDKYWTEDE
jgi:hypothetical protein